MVTSCTQNKRDKHLPGEEGFWVFVLGDLVVFSLFFGTFLVYRAQAPADYDAAQRDLNLILGTLNTIILLTSSWLVARGMAAARHSAHEDMQRRFRAAALLGLVFCCIKAWEYGEKFSAGIGITTNDFYMFFFMLTGIHLVHVLIGVVTLFLVSLQVRSTNPTPSDMRMLEIGATFWHLVDLLWIVLFSLFYLLRS